MEMTGTLLCGLVLSWERPRFTHGTWRSQMLLQEEKEGMAVTVHVSTHRAEDHVWLTRVGQHVVAHDVAWLDSWAVHTSRAAVTAEEEVTFSCALFENLAAPARKVTGLKREAPTLLLVSLEGPGRDHQVVVVKCVDRTCFNAFQVGETVALFNLIVKSWESNTLYFTERSGIRHITRQAKRRRSLSPPPPPSRPIRQHVKWRCLMCGWLNHPSLTCCHSCQRTRTEGPESLFDFGRHNFAPRWQCKRCGHEHWQRYKQICWRCEE